MTFEQIVKYAADNKDVLVRFDIDTPKRLAAFFAVVKGESECVPIAENMNYTSAQRLCEVFPSYFKTKEQAMPYLRNAEKLGNYVYANRMGNGNAASGDGYKFRGRGYLQTTGWNNYTFLSNDTGIDFVANPDLLLQPKYALLSACYYWKRANANRYADIGDFDGCVDVVAKGKKTAAIGDAISYQKKFGYYKQFLKMF